MLNCVVISRPDQKLEFIKSLRVSRPFWIVNDLESKFWYQHQLLNFNEGQVIYSDSVIRASELWHRMLIQVDPHWTLLPSQLSRYLIEKWMREIIRHENLPVSFKDHQRVVATMVQILPLLSHFQGEDALEEWFAEQPEAKERWYNWYRLSRHLWDRFLERKIIPGDWMKAIMIHKDLPQWNQTPFVFDLGLDIDDIEAELILNLSRMQEVMVLVPESEQGKDHYQNLLNRCEAQRIPLEGKKADNLFRKFPSMLSEVKEAVARVRQWLEQGISIDEIALTSPQIEMYWPTLYEHLREEGIPCAKEVMTPLSQIPFYQNWLAHIRIALNRMQKGDGESILYGGVDEPDFDHRKFQVLFENIYDPEDFHREEWVKERIPPVDDPEGEVSLSDFLQWSSQWVSKENWPLMEEVLESLDEVFLLDERLKKIQWLDFFENYFSRTETHVRGGVKEALKVVSLSGVENLQLKKIVCLGLSENMVQDKQNTALLWKDVESIKLNFGFSLPHTDRLEVVDRLRWLCRKPVDEIHFLYSETDFAGSYQAPSVFWLKEAIEHNHDLEVESPLPTLWDEKQFFFLNNKQELDLAAEKRIQMDLGETLPPPVPLNSLSLSASSIEEFYKCPFRLFAQKGLGLKSLPYLDLDLDRMSSGILMHKVCELIVRHEKFQLSDEEIEKIIEKARELEETPIYSESMWTFLKPQYVELTRRFLAAEKEWREKYPATQTPVFEQFLETTLDSIEGHLAVGKGGFPLTGRIDRIDVSEKGEVVLIDYKSTGSGLTQAKSWLKNGRFQLFLYSSLLMEGVLGEKYKNVVGAFYYILKDCDRTKGFAMSEADSKFLPPSKTAREDIEGMIDEARQAMAHLIEKAREGEFIPEPSDAKTCETCEWNQLCRNPVLNQ